ncbi:unnamed protein product [Rotaria sp. Silwood2]|nr:unnamed protein product [Rotaria sp. Silwood2]
MSTEEKPSLSTLPTELIFYIFCYLDAPTIIRSFRKVCKRFYKIVPTYDRFKFDFKSILKSDFHLLCNLIHPKNVESLTLSDDDETPGQIVYFLSIFRISQFTRLRSLTLFEIDDYHLSIILKDIKALELNSLSIYSKKDYSQGNTNVADLLPVTSLPRLFTFNFNIQSFDATNILWPFQCKIEHLEIYCHTLDECCNLFCHLSNLRTLVVEQLNVDDIEQTISKLANFEPIYRLSSLTFKYCTVDVTILQLLLSHIPSLEHLRLMRSVSLNDFTSHLSEWEKFVGTKLPLLNKFEIFLVDDQPDVLTQVDTESLVALFRTPFWTKTKNWLVICDYITDRRSVFV